MHFKSIIPATCCCICFVAPAAMLLADQGDEAPIVQELSEGNWDKLIPQGKEVDAIYGDFVLQNSHLRAVIAKPLATRNANMTVRNVGGCLIDLTIRDLESDQLSAFFPGRRAFAFSNVDVSSEAHASVTNGKGTSSQTSTLVVRCPETNALPEYSVAYSLTESAHSLTIKSTWKNSTVVDVTLTMEDDLRADSGKEDMPKSSNGTHELFRFHDIFWKQAYGIHAPGFRIRCNSNTRESVLVYEPLDGKPVILKPGESFSLKREVFVRADLAGVLADFDEATGKGDSLASCTLKVMAHGKPVQGARVALLCGDSDRGTVVTSNEGSAKLRLPTGACSATISIAGQSFEPQTITVATGSELTVSVDKYTAGSVDISVTDGNGHPLPAKIQFKGNGETPTPNWGPETAELFVRDLAYTPNGKVTTTLMSGEYDITVSHGPEYNAEFTKLKIEPGRTTQLAIKLPRVIETPGWISADFHSHSSPSGDNTGSQLGRVLNLAAEHVEFAPCTEHNRISTYDQHIKSQKLEGFLATVSGMELTGSPLPLNHQNVFPLIHHPRTQDGGAPTSDLSPETQMERAAAWDNNSVKLIQQNHPDIGWLFFDRNGDQVADEGYSRSFGIMNVTEIHPIDPLLNPSQFEMRDGKAINNQTAVNWLQLLNQGFRIYGVVNTDAHYNHHGSGGLRIWLKSSTDDPSKINSDEMRDAARNGHIVMSNGPYLEASFSEPGNTTGPVVSGQDLISKSRKVKATVKVQCPNWFDVDMVSVLVNGRRLDKLTFTREKDPAMFAAGTVKFKQDIEVELTEDAHLVVLTGHRTQVIGELMGPLWGLQHPTAVSNPVFVDVDGNGFTANKDTLDFPLPVKFTAQK